MYEIVPLPYVTRSINPDQPLFVDTETDGLYGEIVMAQFMQEDWEEALLVELPDVDRLKVIIKQCNTVWQNASYDFSCLNFDSDEIGILHFNDTLMLSKLYYFKEEKHSLDEIYIRVLGYDPYAELNLDKKVMQKTNWRGKLTDAHYRYAAIDVYYMPEVWKVLKGTTTDENYKLDIITIKHCLELQKRGLPLLSLVQEQKDTLKLLADYEAQLPMNPRSSQQVAKIMGMRDGTGADKLAVLEANGGDRGAMATLIRQARVESKYNSTYLKKMVGHGRWYGHFAPSTRSGRLASKDNNLQNLPRKMKKFIGFSQIDDKVIVSADFAQLEMRTVACIADDKKMIKLFVDGEDLHGYMADVIFGSGYTKAQRNIAKVANFSLLYGASAKTFAAILLKQTGIAITEQEAQKVKSKWLATFKGVANWQQAGIKSWRAGNYNWTPLGRKYKAKMMTDYLNIQNQGAGGEVAKLAFNRIMKGFSYRDSYMINFVHDSFLAECPNDPEIYEAVAKLFVKSMVKAWEDYITVHPNFASVPMPTEAGVALTWADADGMTDECFYTYKEV